MNTESEEPSVEKTPVHITPIDELPFFKAEYGIVDEDGITAHPIKTAMKVIGNAIREDDSYAIAWVSNLAMLLFDAGVEITEANKRAVSFIKIAFKVDKTELLNTVILKDKGSNGGSDD